MVRQYWPDLPVHASTQLTANSSDDVKAFEALGLKTAVLSREINLKEISYIAANTDMRIESFIHGALCVCYSGQCLMSSVLGNRSGNRGKCAQNCRLTYELIQGKQTIAEGHLLSTKDICTLALLPELLAAGVASLKIEGRMKSPEYVAGVTGIYRKYLDMYYSGDPYQVDPDDILILQQLFNRGAFSEGYLRTHSGMKMMCPTHPKHWGVSAGKVLSYDRKKQAALIRFDKVMVPGDGIEIRTNNEEGVGTYLNKASAAGQKAQVNIRGEIRENQAVYQTYDKRLMDELKPRYETIIRKVPLKLTAVIRAGQTAELTAEAAGISVSVRGDIPTAAQNQPLTVESVAAQLTKLGNTIYRCENIQVNLEEGLYLNKSSLNTLRNTAAEEMRKQANNSYKRTFKNHSLSENINIFTLQKNGLQENEKRSDFPANAGGQFHSAQAPHETVPSNGRSLSVCVRTAEQFRASIGSSLVSVITLEMNRGLMADIQQMCQAAHERGKRVFVRLPRIWREYIRENHAADIRKVMESNIDGFLISCLGHYHAVKDSGKAFSLDFTGNVLNSRSYEFWKELGAERIALSVEMNRDGINALPDLSRTELLAYGYLPLMVTHQCPVGNFAGNKQDSIHCEKYGHGKAYMLRSGKDSFRLETDCGDCVCTITTSLPLDIGEDVNSFKVKTFRLNFTDESQKVTELILKKYEQILFSGYLKKSENSNIYDKTVL